MSSIMKVVLVTASGLFVLFVLVIGFIGYRLLAFRPSRPVRSPVAQAVFDGDKEKVKRLLNAGADPNSTMDTTYRIGPNGTMQSIMEISSTGNTVPEVGMPVLSMAAFNGDAEIVRMLLGKGAKVDSRDKYGQTPLILAAWQGHAESVELLLKQHADWTLRDQSGKTALAWAQTETNVAAAEAMQKAGAKE